MSECCFLLKVKTVVRDRVLRVIKCAGHPTDRLLVEAHGVLRLFHMLVGLTVLE